MAIYICTISTIDRTNIVPWSRYGTSTTRVFILYTLVVLVPGQAGVHTGTTIVEVLLPQRYLTKSESRYDPTKKKICFVQVQEVRGSSRSTFAERTRFPCRQTMSDLRPGQRSVDTPLDLAEMIDRSDLISL